MGGALRDRCGKIARSCPLKADSVYCDGRFLRSMRNVGPAARRPVAGTSGRKSSGRRFRGTREEIESASCGETPAFCGSPPVLISANSSGSGPAGRSPSPKPRTGSAGRRNGWRRTAPPPPSPCWTAGARPNGARSPGCRALQLRPLGLCLLHPVLAEHPLPGRNHSVQWPRRRRSWTPPPASPNRRPGRHPCRRARSPTAHVGEAVVGLGFHRRSTCWSLKL